MKAIFKRDFKSYFSSPIAYVLFGLFIFISSLYFASNISSGTTNFSDNLSSMSFFLIFIMPVLTMKLLSEEKKNGTEVLLFTSPSSIFDIAIGKYLAAFCVFLIMTAITLIYPIIMMIHGDVYLPSLLSGYIGFILLGASYLSVGLFVSACTDSQIIAVTVSIVFLMVMWIMDFIVQFVAEPVSSILAWISLSSKQNDFSQGLLSLGPVVYFLSFIFVFLFLTCMRLAKKRWSQG